MKNLLLIILCFVVSSCVSKPKVDSFSHFVSGYKKQKYSKVLVLAGSHPAEIQVQLENAVAGKLEKILSSDNIFLASRDLERQDKTVLMDFIQKNKIDSVVQISPDGSKVVDAGTTTYGDIYAIGKDSFSITTKSVRNIYLNLRIHAVVIDTNTGLKVWSNTSSIQASNDVEVETMYNNIALAIGNEIVNANIFSPMPN